uniref:Uncharacterized protein n=1 Tax=Ditylenchus dipsaci TaxID=166011 RepID=A0A915EFQ6_9BILA
MEQASRYFLQVLKDFPENKEAKVDLKNTTDRLKESRNGQRIDVADYTGPVSIVDVPGKGRGLVASKNIPKGTLLLVSKAFATTYDDELPNVIILSVNMLNDKGVLKTEALNLIKTGKS